EKKNFIHFTQVPWNISIDDIFAVDATITGISGGKKGAVLWLKEELKVLFDRMLVTFRRICNEIPNHVEDSLKVLEKQHEPHLGLLFSFIHLFKFFQRDQNQLTQKHLD